MITDKEVQKVADLLGFELGSRSGACGSCSNRAKIEDILELAGEKNDQEDVIRQCKHLLRRK